MKLTGKIHLLYALALIAVVLLGALVFGFSVGTLLMIAIVLACPLMMMFMMSSMGGQGGGSPKGHDSSDQNYRDRTRQ